ncbi:MAG: hypothetical protein M1821_005711, partial [Bathelium mastoideum]
INDQSFASCNNPSNQTFQAPPYWDLVSYYPVPISGPSTPLAEWSKAKAVTSSTSVAATTSLTSSLTSSDAASGSSSSHKASQLSSEARAGVGVGVSLAILLFCGMSGVIWFFMRRARNVRPDRASSEVFEKKDSSNIMWGDSRRKNWFSKQKPVTELAGATQQKHELPAQDRQELSVESVFDRYNAVFPIAAYQM